jgi:rubrerythrin
MDEHLTAQLQEAVTQESQAVIRCLVAAERAVEDGRFNIAKVMRAAAHTARIRAMHLQRLLTAQGSPVAPVEAEQQRRHAQHIALAEALRYASGSASEEAIHRLQRLQAVVEPLLDILDRAVDSLRHHRDVMESDVAQFLWGCYECGYIAETAQPETCPHCGALGAEFERFGPFYVVTDEQLGRRRAEEITAILQESPTAVANAVAGLPDDLLRRRPTPDEWCMKEIAGHMVDVTELFLERVRRILDAETPAAFDPPIPAWRILEGKGYAAMDAQEIVTRFHQATEAALARIRSFSSKEWTRIGLIHGKSGNILDVGTWLANHNVAHLKQIEALREHFTQTT